MGLDCIGFGIVIDFIGVGIVCVDFLVFDDGVDFVGYCCVGVLEVVVYG